MILNIDRLQALKRLYLLGLVICLIFQYTILNRSNEGNRVKAHIVTFISQVHKEQLLDLSLDLQCCQPNN